MINKNILIILTKFSLTPTKCLIIIVAVHKLPLNQFGVSKEVQVQNVIMLLHLFSIPPIL